MPDDLAAAVPADHLMAVYARAPLSFERGEGARLYTAEGEAYLDCLAGIATTRRTMISCSGLSSGEMSNRRVGKTPTSRRPAR